VTTPWHIGNVVSSKGRTTPVAECGVVPRGWGKGRGAALSLGYTTTGDTYAGYRHFYASSLGTSTGATQQGDGRRVHVLNPGNSSVTGAADNALRHRAQGVVHPHVHTCEAGEGLPLWVHAQRGCARVQGTSKNGDGGKKTSWGGGGGGGGGGDGGMSDSNIELPTPNKGGGGSSAAANVDTDTQAHRGRSLGAPTARHRALEKAGVRCPP
jgi:hypothetical protein